MTYVSSFFSRRGGRSLVLPLLLAAALLVGGCDDGELLPPDPEAGDLFARYASVGNSITAGFQSGGINASLQQDAYPNLLAQQMDTEFRLPLLSAPGCPPPLVQIFPEPQTLGGDQAPPCALRAPDIPRVLNNVAVPGAEVIDVLSNADAASNANALTTFILGGRTQIEAVGDVDPTFVSAWIGNNDVLGAALAGEPALATPESDFTTRYGNMLDELDALPDLEGGVLFSVVNVTLVPNFSAGAAYAAAIPQAQSAGAAPPNLSVDASCAPASVGGVGDQMLVPFQYGAALLSVASALSEDLGGAAPTVTLYCSQDLTVEEAVGQSFGGVANIPSEISAAIEDVSGVSLLQTAEIATIQERVVAFNTYISQEADSRGYAYVDVNALLQQPEFSQQIPPFPELIENPQTPWGPDQPFGPLFSLDGVHPSSAAHEVVTDAAIGAINSEYGTNIPALSQ
jgi:hypothetical protein